MTLSFLQSPAGADPIIVEGVFRAPPERVFRAWTRPEEVRAWFGLRPGSLASAEIDLRIGGAWRFAFPATEAHRDVLGGIYTIVEPSTELAFSWVHERNFSDGRIERTPASQVSVSFRPAPEGTLVRLVHAAIRTEDVRKGVGNGWTAAFAAIQAVLSAETAG